MVEVFIQLAFIVAIAFAASFILKLFKQPIIIGYIIAGVLISPFILKFQPSTGVIQLFSDLGIAFLLFMVGIHLNPKIIKEIGFSSLIIGISQIIVTFIVSFVFLAYIMHYSSLISVYLAIAITFSSTIIVMKILSDNGKLESLYGKISVAILILQDFVAVFVLMFASSIMNQTSFTSFATEILIKGVLTVVLLFFFSYLAIPKITAIVAKSQELLFLFAISWCFILSALFFQLGFSIEIGALLAGMTLSISQFNVEISSKIRPLRDFFIVIFFIILGLNIPINSLGKIIVPALWISLFVIIIKPLIIMTIMAISGHKKRNNFLTAIGLAQISEFSLIIVAVGARLGHLSQEALSTITLAGIITITVSTYLMIFSEKIYNKTSFMYKIFERKQTKDIKELREKYDVMLFGYNRIGFGLLHSLKKINKSSLVIDFNPETISSLKKRRINCIYGDVSDCEFLEDLPIKHSKMAISTIPDFETNSLLIKEIRRNNKEAIIIVIAHQIKEAFELYRLGATYVLTPHFLGGDYVGKMIENYKTDVEKYELEKKEHMKNLDLRLKEGHEHPKREHGK